MAKRSKQYRNELIGAARRLGSSASAPRRHHLVPASYLRRWESIESLWVTDLTTRGSYPTTAAKAARETDFYRIEADDIDPDVLPPLLVETILGSVEGAAVPAIDELIANGAWTLSNEHRFGGTLFMSFQLCRGRQFRGQLQLMTSGMARETLRGVRTPEDVRTRHGAETPPEEVDRLLRGYAAIERGEMQMLHRKEALIAMSAQYAVQLGEFLFGRDWIVYETELDLVTVDEPVVLLGGRHMPRGARAGVMSAGVIIFPLDPRHLLAMFDPAMALTPQAIEPELSSDETHAINLELVANAHRWRFSRGGAKAPSLPMLPPPVPMAMVEGMVPVINEPGAKVAHTFSPTRWLYAPDQPLPVVRWWELDDRPPIGTRPDTPWVPKSGVIHVPEAGDSRPT